MLPLQHPFTAIVAGPTGCGKSEWVLRLIDHAKKMTEPPPEEIWYCYGEFQPIFSPDVKFHEGMPSFTKFDDRRSTFLIMNDLMTETNDGVANLFTKRSHHRNVSVMFLTENLFHKNRHMRTITVNLHSMVLFKNPPNAGQFSILDRQMYWSSWKLAEEAYGGTADCGCCANKEKEEQTSDFDSLLECHMPIQKHRVVSVAYRTSDDMVVK